MKNIMLIIAILLFTSCTAIRVNLPDKGDFFWVSTKKVNIEIDHQKGIFKLQTDPDSQYMLLQKITELIPK